MGYLKYKNYSENKGYNKGFKNKQLEQQHATRNKKK